jgi:hypothetical protein
MTDTRSFEERVREKVSAVFKWINDQERIYREQAGDSATPGGLTAHLKKTLEDNPELANQFDMRRPI